MKGGICQKTATVFSSLEFILSLQDTLYYLVCMYKKVFRESIHTVYITDVTSLSAIYELRSTYYSTRYSCGLK